MSDSTPFRLTRAQSLHPSPAKLCFREPLLHGVHEHLRKQVKGLLTRIMVAAYAGTRPACWFPRWWRPGGETGHATRNRSANESLKLIRNANERQRQAQLNALTRPRHEQLKTHYFGSSGTTGHPASRLFTGGHGMTGADWHRQRFHQASSSTMHSTLGQRSRHTVIDLDRLSGRPLHGAPATSFLGTMIIRNRYQAGRRGGVERPSRRRGAALLTSRRAESSERGCSGPWGRSPKSILVGGLATGVTWRAWRTPA